MLTWETWCNWKRHAPSLGTERLRQVEELKNSRAAVHGTLREVTGKASGDQSDEVLAWDILASTVMRKNKFEGLKKSLN